MHLMLRSICNQSPSFTIEFLLLNQHINFIESFGLYLCRKTDNIPFFVYFLQKNEAIFDRKLFWIKHSSHFECRFFFFETKTVHLFFVLKWKKRICCFGQEFFALFKNSGATLQKMLILKLKIPIASGHLTDLLCLHDKVSLMDIQNMAKGPLKHILSTYHHSTHKI